MNVDRVAILVKRAALEFDKLANPVLNEYDLTVSQYKILKYLYAQPSRTARTVDIERQYSMTHPTAIGLLDNLEKKGFVCRMPNPDDARSRLIALTGKADAMEAGLLELGDRLERQLTARLTARETEQLIRLLKKLMGVPDVQESMETAKE